MPTLLVAHLHFFQQHKVKQKNAKEPPSQHTRTDIADEQNIYSGQTPHDNEK